MKNPRWSCPECTAAAKRVGGFYSMRGDVLTRIYMCIKGHEFNTKEVYEGCVDYTQLRKLRDKLKETRRKEAKRLYVIQHPEMTIEAVAKRLRIPESTAHLYRSSSRVRTSRLTPRNLEDSDLEEGI